MALGAKHDAIGRNAVAAGRVVVEGAQVVEGQFAALLTGALDEIEHPRVRPPRAGAYGQAQGRALATQLCLPRRREQQLHPFQQRPHVGMVR